MLSGRLFCDTLDDGHAVCLAVSGILLTHRFGSVKNQRIPVQFRATKNHFLVPEQTIGYSVRYKVPRSHDVQ